MMIPMMHAFHPLNQLNLSCPILCLLLRLAETPSWNIPRLPKPPSPCSSSWSSVTVRAHALCAFFCLSSWCIITCPSKRPVSSQTASSSTTVSRPSRPPPSPPPSSAGRATRRLRCRLPGGGVRRGRYRHRGRTCLVDRQRCRGEVGTSQHGRKGDRGGEGGETYWLLRGHGRRKSGRKDRRGGWEGVGRKP
jgi:hypothetical protein